MESQLLTLNSLAMTHRDLTSGLKDIGGISATGYQVLLLISETDKGIRITQIADELGFKFTSVSAVVETLVGKKLVTRKNDPHDKRAFRLFVTQEGRDVLKKINKTLLSRLKKRWKPLNEKQLGIILIDLNKDYLTSEYVKSIELSYRTGESALKESGITYTQFLILFQLAIKGDMRPSDLSRSLDQKPATISVAMNGLEKKGYITRGRLDDARSVMNISLTDTGKTLAFDKAHDIQRSLDRINRHRYSAEEREELTIISELVVNASTR